MDQKTYDEMNRLSDTLREVNKTWRAESKEILPLNRGSAVYTEEVKALLKISYDKMQKESAELDRQYKEIIDKCDHRHPDGYSVVRWTPCDTSRCGFCGMDAEEIYKITGVWMDRNE